MMTPVDSSPADASRVAWQCRRGMRELDELLGRYLRARYAQLDEAERATFDELLDYPDAVLLECLMGRMQPADAAIARIVRDIRDTAAA